MSDRNQRQINQFFANLIAKIRKWLIKIGSPFRISRRLVRSLLNQAKGQGRGKRSSQSGFVLPTVVMVTVTVTLLVTLMVARSAERARTASNARVEQAVRLATTPAIDRARIKLEELLSDDALGRGTPPDSKIYDAIKSNAKYTFDDEIRLQITADVSGDGKIDPSDTIATPEFTNTAWKYPIDTDNNGKYDSIGIYSIQFRARPSSATTRAVAVTEARTPPMDDSAITSNCVFASGGGAEAEGWYTQGAKLKKPFFVYAATVPITSLPVPGVDSTDTSKYEVYQGNKAFGALELQQDRTRESLNNAAVWFEDDLELARAAKFNINGKIFTNSNLMVGAANASNPIALYQVSSPFSCQYKQDNAKVLVAGNVVSGDTMTTASGGLLGVNLHLFQGAGVDPTSYTPPDGGTEISNSTQTVGNSGAEVAFNNFAYAARLNALVTAAQARTVTPKYPTSVQKDITDGIAEADALRTYFKNRTRKVPYKEVPFNKNNAASTDPQNPLGTWTQATLNTYLSGTGSATYNDSNGVITSTTGIELAPPPAWGLPPYSGAPATFSLGSGVSFPTGGANDLTFATTQLNATSPDKRKGSYDFKEVRLGDRLTVGNNLPGLWYNTTYENKFAGQDADYTLGTSTYWTEGTSATETRKINTQIDTLADLGDFGRDGFWEEQAAASPTATDSATTAAKTCADGCNEISPVRGGLRVVTGAGIYSTQSTQTFLSRPTALADSTNSILDLTAGGNISEAAFSTNNYVVWPDSMPMTGAVRWLDSTTTPSRSTAGYYKALTKPTRSDYASNSVGEANYQTALTDFKTASDRWETTIASATNNSRKGDLQMRATAVYHYKTSVYDSGTPATYQKPIACVSSYYDPTNSYTARNGFYNGARLPDVSGLVDTPDSTTGNIDGTYDLLANGQAIPTDMALNSNTVRGRSNNGVTYSVNKTASDVVLSNVTYSSATGLFSGTGLVVDPVGSNSVSSLSGRLAYQANLVFPNGRFVNPQLRAAMIKVAAASGGSAANANLSLAEQAAIDSSLCSLQILDATLTVSATPTAPGGVSATINLPHGTIKESSFLDGREVKSLNRDESLTATNPSNNGNTADIYDLEIEQRQPLEIRATDIDMERLRGNTIAGPNNAAAATAATPGVPTEYLLPYSGLVYATRDDAQEDLSNRTSTLDNSKQLSPTDFLLDPTRRPNAIRLINGKRIWRGTGTAQPAWTAATRGEKGLILVTPLPVYVKGNFNQHTQEEFTNALEQPSWSDFYSRSASEINVNFACRPDPSDISPRPACDTGDEWRSATIIADAPTVVSGNSKDGFRVDGDYDLRNNAETSGVANILSNTNVPGNFLATGFWNNNFVTNASYLTDTENVYPDTRRNTYLGNGVTPVQRRETTYEYSMEICRKLPATSCTAHDWTGIGAGTTVAPTSSTPTTAPRYIAPEDLKFPRRVHFLRSDDVYGDGSKALIMTSVCGNAKPSYPIAIGVTNGNLATGSTFAYVNVGPNESCQALQASTSASATASASISSSISASTASSSSASASSSVFVSSSTASSSASASVASSSASASRSAASPSASASRSAASPSASASRSAVSPSASASVSRAISRSASSSRASSIASASAPSASAASSSASSSRASSVSSSVASSSASASRASSAASASAPSASAASSSASASRASSSASSSVSASAASRSSSASSLASSSVASSSASSSVASSVSVSRSRSASASAAGGISLLRVPSFGAMSPGLPMMSGGATPRLPSAALLPRLHNLAAVYNAPAEFPLDGTGTTSSSQASKDAKRFIPNYLGAPTLPTGFSNTVPTQVARALWYRVNSNPTSDILGNPATIDYNATGNKALYVYAADAGNGLSRAKAPKIFLPDIRSFIIPKPSGSVDVATLLNATNPTATVPDAPSDYAICTTGARSRYTRATATNSPTEIVGDAACPTAVLTSISDALGEGAGNPQGFRGLLKDSGGNKASTVDLDMDTGSTKWDGDSDVIIDAGSDNFYVVQLPDLPAGKPIADDNDVVMTLRANPDNPNAVFLLGMPNKDTIIGTSDDPATTGNQDNKNEARGLKMKLDGVSPNNIFWVFGKNAAATTNLVLNDTYKDPAGDTGIMAQNAKHRTVLMGNFIGDRDGPVIPRNMEFRNARFLGFQTPPSFASNVAAAEPDAAITAMTSDNEPLLLPVLQFHTPDGTPGSSGTNLDQTGKINGGAGKWTEIATASEVNAYFVAGNTPSRSFVNFNNGATTVSTAETGGGLQNFIRYMENWNNGTAQVASRISGGFIQTRRSAYDTAPFSVTAPYNNLTDFNDKVNNSSAIASLFETASAGISKKFYQSDTAQVLPFYFPPARLWGYDVGILSQPADLFALRFSGSVPYPNEFFREIGKDDDFVKALLCAVEPAGVTTAAADPKRKSGSTVPVNTYTEFALPSDQRPGCNTPPTYL